VTHLAPVLPPEAALPSCDERLQELYSYWISIHPARGVLPGRQHVDPAAIPRLLPWIWLLDFQRAPLRFKYRLVGTEHVKALGRDATGEWLDEAHPHYKSSASPLQLAQAVNKAEVGFLRGPAVNYAKKEWMAIERIVLPLARNGIEVDMLLGMTLFGPAASNVSASLIETSTISH
jgi:hypothetical protein